jgi:uncharacterized membrane protein YhaH (DUF805 family)
MDFVTAIKTCFSKYAIFQGRAARSEFWWWVLFAMLVNGVLWAISRRLQIVAGAALFLPNLAVSVRRLHDLDRSGWFLALPAPFWVIGFILGLSAGLHAVFSAGGGSAVATSVGVIVAAGIFGLMGFGAQILLLIWFCQKSTPGPNRYGEAPLASMSALHAQPTVVS